MSNLYNKIAREIDYNAWDYHLNRQLLGMGPEAQLVDAYPYLSRFGGRAVAAGARAGHTGEGAAGSIAFGEAKNGVMQSAPLVAVSSAILSAYKVGGVRNYLRRALTGMALGSGLAAALYAGKGIAKYQVGKGLSHIISSPFKPEKPETT